MTRYAAAATAATCALMVILGALGLVASTLFPDERHDGPPAPVLLELFTSEGCSSCPAADRLLTRLLEEQPVGNARVIALGEHVDYWDRLGWRDPFSSAAFTNRQVQYQAWVFPLSTVYTPQLVIDGTREAIGSAESAVRRAVATSARSPKGTLRIDAERPAGGRVDIAIRLSSLPAGKKPADLYAAVAQDGLVTSVRGGENSGRTLTHSAVARSLGIVTAVPRDQPDFAATATLALNPDWGGARLRIVAFVQERGTRRVLAVAEQPLVPAAD